MKNIFPLSFPRRPACPVGRRASIKKITRLYTSACVFAVSILLFLPIMALGADDITFTPQVTIPGTSDFANQKEIIVSDSLIGDYISAFFNFAVPGTAILAVVMMMYGGVIWLTSGGSTERISQAKQYVSGAISGMVLLLASYLILNTVSPDLVSLQFPTIVSPEKPAPKLPVPDICCYTAGGGFTIMPVQKNKVERCDGTIVDIVYCQEKVIPNTCRVSLRTSGDGCHRCFNYTDYNDPYEALCGVMAPDQFCCCEALWAC